jgi:acyl carrier protein
MNKPFWQRSAPLSEEAVFGQIRVLIADTLGLPLSQLTRDSSFIKDLGVD